MFEVMSRENRRNPDEKVPFIVIKHDVIQALGGIGSLRRELEKSERARAENGTAFTPRLKKMMPWYTPRQLANTLTAVLGIIKADVSEKALDKIPCPLQELS